jgi:hypothetical protein
VNQYEYSTLGDENVGGATCWMLKAVPRKKSQYDESHVLVRKDNYVAVRIDNFKGGKVVRKIEYSDIVNAQGIWTPQHHEIFDSVRNSRTILVFDKLEYNQAMKDENFTLQALRREQ